MERYELEGYWDAYSNTRDEFCFGQEEFDIKEFTLLVKETYEAIKEFKINILGENKDSRNIDNPIKNKGITGEYIFDYSRLLIAVSKYCSGYSLPDDSEGYVFSASKAVARGLINYASWGFGKDDGIIDVCFDDMELNESAYDEFIEEEMIVSSNFCKIEYDVYKSNIEEIMNVIQNDRESI